jgi:hypothetical protein
VKRNLRKIVNGVALLSDQCGMVIYMKKAKSNSNISEIARAARVADRKDRLDAMRDGRRQTAHTFVDRKKEAARRACRR